MFQFAYKSRRSPIEAVATLLHHVLKSLDKKHIFFKTIFLDFSNTFNTIPRPLILNRWASIGTPGWLVSWLRDYFQNRTQLTKVGKAKSTALPNEFGFPQGTIWSTFMFAAHTDVLQTPNAQLMKYTYDIAINSSMTGHSSLTQLNGDLQFISSWAENNGLSLNPAKCVQMVFQIGHSNTLPCKYIGVIMTPNFSMEGANSVLELTD